MAETSINTILPEIPESSKLPHLTGSQVEAVPSPEKEPSQPLNPEATQDNLDNTFAADDLAAGIINKDTILSETMSLGSLSETIVAGDSKIASGLENEFLEHNRNI